jgi:hypothetical protein
MVPFSDFSEMLFPEAESVVYPFLQIRRRTPDICPSGPGRWYGGVAPAHPFCSSGVITTFTFGHFIPSGNLQVVRIFLDQDKWMDNESDFR